MQAFSLVGAGMAKIPGSAPGINAAAARFVKTSTGGPDEEARAATGSRFVAEALGASGDVARHRPPRGRQRLHVQRREPGLGGRADRRRRLAAAPARSGPVEAFGLDALEAGVAECGISRVG